MQINDPKATSTPTVFHRPTCRRPLRGQSIQSPINLPQDSLEDSQGNRSLSPSQRVCERSSNVSPKSTSRKTSQSDGLFNSDDESDSSMDSEEICTNRASKTPSFYLKYLAILLLLAAPFIFITYEYYEPTSRLDLDHDFALLNSEFRHQKKDFWPSIKVAIKEVAALNSPRCIILLHERRIFLETIQILSAVSQLALCHLRSCSTSPMLIGGDQLAQGKSDYGLIISKYRKELEEKGVMQVLNLQQIPGQSAQAFHSFCDEYNPVVRRALIIFTMEVNEVPEQHLTKFVEDELLEKWKDIGQHDKFYPLFTRISGTILPVEPENF